MTAERFGEFSIETGVEDESKPKRKGVALLIVDSSSLGSGNPRIWTINELTSKAETHKVAGEVSFPAETKKEDEDEVDTVLGGLAEFTDSDEIVGQLRINPKRFYAKSAIKVNGFAIDLAVISYEGSPDALIEPTDRNEVAPNGWMETSELQLLNGSARSIVSDSINFALEHGMLEALAAEQDKTVPLTALKDQYSSLKAFLDDRDTKEDVPLH
jgi:hypothetical protein